MTTAIGTIKHKRGETISFALRQTDTEYADTETVTCDVKLAVNGSGVPAESAAVVLSITPVFVAAVGSIGTVGYLPTSWVFSISAATSAALGEGNYITDARVLYASGFVDYPEPLAIKIEGRVTA
jgi:hypothetical protein